MQVFVHEFVCGGGLAGMPLPDSLAREGWAMLAAIVEDLAQVRRLRVVTTLDPRLRLRLPRGVVVERPREGVTRSVLARLARDADATLLIAPEMDGILVDRACWVEAAGGRLLGPSPPAIRIAGNKQECCDVLRRHDVPVVPCSLLDLGSPGDFAGQPCVLKPVDGAGSHCTFLVRNAASWRNAIRELAEATRDSLAHAAGPEASLTEGGTGLEPERGSPAAMLQPFVPGTPASVALLVHDHAIHPLQPCRQEISRDGRLRYLGGSVPLAEMLRARAVALAVAAVQCVPGLRGYVGVDLVLSVATPDSGRFAGDAPTPDLVLEINPRLTTSYVGLRRATRQNLAELMLRGRRGEALEPVRWEPGTVCFRADGSVA